MKGPSAASGRDLRALARIVTDDRGDPPAEGLPPSLLSDLAQLVGCDFLVFGGTDSSRMTDWFGQTVPAEADDPAYDLSSFWAHYWDSPCSHPERTGDLRSLVKVSDFYTARQWHSTGMYQDCCRPYGIEHELMLCLPGAPAWTAGPGRSLRLIFVRGPGPDFSSRHHDRLTSKPNAAATRSHGSPPGSRNCCAWWPPGTPTPRSPAAWAFPTGRSAPTWKTSTACCRYPAGPPPSPAPSRTGNGQNEFGRQS
jgi:hypothetical protein